MDVPEEILKLFQEKYYIQSLRLELKQQNIRAKDNYLNINLANRTTKMNLVSKFLTKLKQPVIKDKDSILNEVDNYHLQKHINDICNFISDLNFVDSDVPYYMQLCSKLHQTYEEFAPLLIQNLIKQIKTNIKQKEKDEKIQCKKRREVMRFIFELFVIGFPISCEKVLECLKEIILQKENKIQLLNVQTVLMFSTQFAYEICGKKGFKIGYYADKYDNLPNIFNFDYNFIPQEKREKILQAMQKYIQSLTDLLKQIYETKKKQSAILEKLIQENIQIDQQEEQQFNRTKNNYKQLFEALSNIADCLELEFRVGFGENETEIKQQQLIEEQKKKKLLEDEKMKLDNQHLFDTEEESTFYQQILDLKTKVTDPTLLTNNNYFGGNTNQNAQNANNEEQVNKNEDDENIDDNDQNNIGNINEEEVLQPNEEFKEEPLQPNEEVKEEENNQIPKTYEDFKKRLKYCVSVDKADLLAEQFLYVNNKQNRKKLVKDILEYRKEYNLMVPQLCRFVCVVSKYFKDLADLLVEKVIKDFNSYKDKNRQDFSFRDKKIRYLKYLCELGKFRCVDLQKILDVLNSLIDDFSTQQIDLVCAIMDNCGRFLYKCSETRFRYSGLLNDLQMKLQKANLPTNKLIQLENSINLSKPSKKRQIKEPKNEPEEQKYINYLIFYVMTEQNFKQFTTVLKQIEWDETWDRYCFKALMKKMIKGKVDQILLCAGLVSFLNTFRPSITVKVVDELYERTIFGMEVNEVQEQQKRINVIRFMSELYIYNVLEIDFIFKMLYLFLDFGHEDFRDEEEQQRIDSQDDLFRISMVCNMIEPLYVYLKRTKHFQRTLKFLVYFHKYILSKRYVPIDIEFMILDTFENLYQDQKLTKIKSLVLAEELISKVEQETQQGKKIENIINEFVNYSEKNKDNEKQIQQKEKQSEQQEENEIDEEEEKRNQILQAQLELFERELKNTIEEHSKEATLNQKNIQNQQKKKIVNVQTKVVVDQEGGQSKQMNIIKKKKEQKDNTNVNIMSFYYGKEGILENENIQIKLKPKKN